MEETGVPGENHWPVASHWQTLSHNVVSSTPRLSGIRTHNVSNNFDTDHIPRWDQKEKWVNYKWIKNTDHFICDKMIMIFIARMKV